MTAIIVTYAILPAHSQDFEYDGIRYSVIDKDNKTCLAKKSVKSLPKSLIIPTIVSDGKTDYTVTEIGPHSFNYSNDLEEVSLPNTITKIGNAGFMNCKNLSSINLPESLVEIGDSAFYKCVEDYWPVFIAARKEITDSRSLIKIPDGVKKIGKRAFMFSMSNGWPKIVPANLPSSLTEIEDYAFYCNCPKDMTMPGNITRIGSHAFTFCQAAYIEIPETVSYIGEYAFSSSAIENVVLPSKISEISRGLFAGCHSLSSINIPESVTKIGKRAFANSGILSIKIPDGVTAIESSTFSESSLSFINIPTTITNIGDSAFYQTLLKGINLPDGITHVGKYAFRGCSLESITLPTSLTEISEYMLAENKSLVSAIIPPSVTKIGDYAFYSSNLTNGIVLPGSIRSIGNGAFSGCQFEEVFLPNSVDSIGEYTLGDCQQLKKVILSDNINQITALMFAGCTSLQSIANHSMPDATKDGNIRIPFGIDTVSYQAFKNCTAIKSIEIPSSVKFIYENPFIGCDSLASFSINKDNRHYKLVDNALLTIGGDTLVAAPLLMKGAYSIPTEVSTIGKQAFYGCSKLESLTMHDGVRNIEQEAFAYCTGLSDPVISNSIVSIGWSAFAGVNFTKIILPPSLKRIENGFGEPFNIFSQYFLESVWIYGIFDRVDHPFWYTDHINSIYYLTDTPQGNCWDELIGDYAIDWGLDPRGNLSPLRESTLYVLEEAYDEIRNGDYSPWSYFNDIRIYDPTDDPFLSSVDEVNNDIGPSLPVSVFTLSGVRVADSTDALPAGIYIVRQGANAKKIAVN